MAGVAPRYFVIHTFPDADCIGASWLALRYLFPLRFDDERLEPRFVPFNGIDPQLLAQATAVFDIGGEFDPARLRFDHHQAADPRATCAARMVWRYLVDGAGDEPPLRPDLAYLDPLVDLIEAGDVGELDARGYGISTTLGVHALLSGFRMAREAALLAGAGDLSQADQLALLQALDLETLHYGWELFDAIALGLQRRAELSSLRDGLVYESADRLVWAIDNAPLRCAPEAFRQGARLLITRSVYPLPRSYMFEVWSAPNQPEPNVRELMQRMMQTALQRGDTGSYAELELFYSERTYAGRGSPKAPNPTPVKLDLIEFVRQIDALWER
jgi:hypothetical protein